MSVGSKTLKEWLSILPTFQDEFPDDAIELLTGDSDPSNFKYFFGKGDAAEQKGNILAVYDFFIEQLNRPTHDLKKKTRLLIVLNNFALYKPARRPLFSAVKRLNVIFEDAMRQEGKMVFDAELGRMSEHVLVLIMRVSSYKLKAAQVLEFADHNTQFGVQLLLAILLKEPPYELELRCNCIGGLLGFTQPQTFFQATTELKEHSCEDFGEKIDFIGNLMLRLSAVQVIHDVLSPVLFDDTILLVPPVVHNAAIQSMRCIMNIFSFSTQAAQQWRQHILLNTPYVDGVVVPYLHKQIRSVLSSVGGVSSSSTMISASGSVSSVPLSRRDIVKGLELSVRFMAFATFHLGRHARYVRVMSYFVHDLFQMPMEDFSIHNPTLYTALLHYMVNIDALVGDEGFLECGEELADELKSDALRTSLKEFLQQFPKGVLDALHERFYSVDCDALVSQDARTFALIDGIFTEQKRFRDTSVIKTNSSTPHNSLLGELPPMRRDRLANSEHSTLEEIKLVKPPCTSSEVTLLNASKPDHGTPPTHLCCALNRHLMRNPVRSPYGHVFEEATIQQWLSLNGSACPLTGKPLTLTDLKPDVDLQRQIVKHHIQETLKHNNPEDDTDLYDF